MAACTNLLQTKITDAKNRKSRRIGDFFVALQRCKVSPQDTNRKPKIVTAVEKNLRENQVTK